MPTKQTRSAVACLAVSLPVTPLLPPPPPHMPITCTQGYICGLQNHYLLIYPEERVVNSWPFSLIDLNGIAICFHLFKYNNQINLPCLIYQLKIRPPWQFRCVLLLGKYKVTCTPLALSLLWCREANPPKIQFQKKRRNVLRGVIGQNCLFYWNHLILLWLQKRPTVTLETLPG